MFKNALAAQHAGDHKLAISLYQRIIATDPENGDALFNLAALAASQQHMDDAVTLYERVLMLKPNDPQALSNLGNICLALGRIETAEAHYRGALESDPMLAPARVNLGLLCAEQGRTDEAEAEYRAAIDADPFMVEAHSNLGAMLVQLERNDEAGECLEMALSIDPDCLQAIRNLGTLSLASGDIDKAEACYRRCVELEPNSALSHYQVGVCQSRREQFKKAIETFELALALDPANAAAWQEIGVARIGLEQHSLANEALEQAAALAPDDPAIAYHWGSSCLHSNDKAGALEHFGRAFELAPDIPEIRNGFASALHENGRHEEALSMVGAVILERPGLSEAHNTHGNCLSSLNRPAEAKAAYQQAIACDPTLAIAHYNLGHLERKESRLDEARIAYEQALKLSPRLVSALNGLGLIEQQRNQHDDAVSYFEQALAIQPEYGDALNNIALSFQALGRFSEAVTSYKALLDIHPDRPEVYFNMGSMLQLLERWDDSITVFKKGISESADCAMIYPYLTHSMMQQCNWHNLDAILAHVRSNTEAELAGAGAVNITPFALHSWPGDFSMALRQQVSERTASGIARAVDTERQALRFEYHKGPRKKRLKIGYVSPDFRFHSVSVAFKGILERHDRDDFELIGYSIRFGRADSMTEFFRDNFDSFVEIGDMPFAAGAQRIHQDEVDILIDLAGHTRGARLELFALKPAPIQAHYLGYSMTLGAKFMDYVISDRNLVPPRHQPFFTEKLVYLPDTFMATQRAPVAVDQPSRADYGLPEDALVFANFNNVYKFEPKIFGIWMRLLRKLPHAVLWTLKGTPKAADNLKREAAARGVDPSRLISADVVPHPVHLARLKLADLALDSYFHGGGVTTLDALWVGLPVLTTAGDTLPSRNGATLLPAIGLEDMVMPDLEAYEQTALALAREPERLAEVRNRLVRNRETKPLFNGERLTRHLETGYRLMWENYVAGHPPQLIEIPALPEQSNEPS